MWIELKDRVGYMKGAVNQGIVLGDRGAILIDTGIDKQAARKLLRLLKELDTKPIAIINTHAHADHFGGNQEIVNQFPDVHVYAPVFEESSIRHPIWEPMYLYGGAYPLTELENKFLLAPASPVHVIYDIGNLVIDGVEFEAIPLYGHSFRQMGIRFGDVLFAADGFYGLEVLEKHPIPYHIDTKETLRSLERLEQMSFSYIVPGHGMAIETEQVRKDTMRANADVYKRNMDLILTICREAKTIDEIHAALCNGLQIEVANAGSFLLYRTAIQALLKYLLGEGLLRNEIIQNKWLWQAVTTE